ncbi:GT2 family glycosyltransferase [Streptomyces sp. SPB4]|nr:GT2 family glycosyltransferase [Streptomyces sp. SPB4]
MLASRDAVTPPHHTHACNVPSHVNRRGEGFEVRKHEETDLAWRAIDHGWKILYEPRLVLQHPKTSPARHAVYYRMTARNRVWLAKRHLSAPLVPVYLGAWVVLTVVRARSVAGLRAWCGGFAEGIRTSGGPRRPMRWQTVWRLTRLGRPPVV